MKLISKHKGTILSLLVVIGTITFLCRGLIAKPGIIAGYDVINFFGGIEQGNIFSQWFQSWDSNWVFGGSMLGIAGKFFSPLFFLWAQLHPLLSVNIHIFILLLLTGISCYLFVYHYTRNVYGSAAAGIFYTINPFTLWCTGQPNVLFGYALFPILLLLFDRALERKTFKDISFFSLFAFLFITSSYMPIVYIGALALALFAVFQILLSHKEKSSTRFFKTLAISFISLALLSGLLSYQIVPIFAKVNPPALSMGFSLKEPLLYSNPIGESFLMLTSPWSLAQTTNDFRFLIIVAILAFSAILFRRDRYTIFFTISALVAVFLAKGPHPPFESIYIWLHNYVPGFAALRETTRWYMLLSVSYAYLLGMSVKFISVRLKSRFKTNSLLAERLISISLVAVVIATCFLSTRPQSLIANLRTFDMNDYPEYTEAKEAYTLIGSRDENIYSTFPIAAEYGLVLATPQVPLKAKEYGIYQYKTQAPVNLSYQSGQPHWEYPRLWLGYKFAGYREFVDSRMNEQSVAKFMDFLGSQNVKYIVIDKTRKKFLEFYQKQDNSKLIFDKETVAVYENEVALPHLYATPASTMLIGGLSSFLALPFIPDFSYSDITLLPPEQEPPPDFLILYNAAVDDFVMLNALKSEGEVQRLDIGKYAQILGWRHQHKENRKGELPNWILSNWWTAKGDLDFGSSAIRVGGVDAISIPFTVNESGDYEMWFRIAYAPDSGDLEALVDGNSVLNLTPKANLYYGFQFAKIPLHLEKGNHTLELMNDGSGFNDVDEALLIKSDIISSLFSAAAQSAPSEVVYYHDAERLFGWNNLGDWRASSSASSTGRPTSITDDNQSSFWNVIEPAMVSISDDENFKRHGTNSLKIATSDEERSYSTMLEHIFPDYQDWSDEEYISLNFYGNNTGIMFSLGVMSGDGVQDYAVYRWQDNFSGWNQILVSLDKPGMSHGNVDLSKVKRLKVGNDNLSASGTWHLDDLGVTSKSQAARTAVEVLESDERPSTISASFRPLREGRYMVAIRARAVGQQKTTQYVPLIVITDDNQSSFWNVIEPAKVSISDDENFKRHGTNSLKIATSDEERSYSTMLEHIFPDYQDWADEEYISLNFYGNNTGTAFSLGVMSGDGGQDYAVYRWLDNFSGWKQILISLDKPDMSHGNVDLSKVKRLKVGNDNLSVSGTWHLDHVTLGEAKKDMAGKTPEQTKLRLTANGSQIVFDNLNTQLQWLEAGPIFLDDTEQTIDLTNDGAIYIDKILLYPYAPEASAGTLFKTPGHTSLDYEKLSPTKYLIHVNTNRSFWLIFTEIYHPLWQAKVDGESIRSTLTSLYLNGFYVTKTGEYDLTLEFEGQRYVKYGGIISLVMLGAMLLYVICSARFIRRNRSN